MIYDTIRDAAAAWVDSFNAVPAAVVEKLMRLDPDEVREITPGHRDEDANYLPMWDTMWSFGDSADDYWLEKGDGLELMAECGFRIYEQEDLAISSVSMEPVTISWRHIGSRYIRRADCAGMKRRNEPCSATQPNTMLRPVNSCANGA